VTDDSHCPVSSEFHRRCGRLAVAELCCYGQARPVIRASPAPCAAITRADCPLHHPATRNTMHLLPGTQLPNPGDRSGYATARKPKMHGIRAVRRNSGNKDPSSREAPRVFFIGGLVAEPGARQPADCPAASPHRCSIICSVARRAPSPHCRASGRGAPPPPFASPRETCPPWAPHTPCSRPRPRGAGPARSRSP